MAIEQQLDSIIKLLQQIAGAGDITTQVAETFSGTEMPAATTDFDTIKKQLVGMPKDMANTWYNQCFAMGKSDAQKNALTKIFKDALA